MIVAIHQPNFLPWLGYFYKMLKSDKFVLLDDVQFTKNSYINRTKIKTQNGDQWLTIPVQMSGNFGKNINDVKIYEPELSTKKILKTIKMNYSRTKYFNLYYPKIVEKLEIDNEYLSNINIKLIRLIKEELNIETHLILSSDINGIEGNSTRRLISICKKLNCDNYLSGFGGANYQDSELFRKSRITLLTTDFEHPIYSQIWGDFIPNLSVIDLLFNCGPESKEIIRKH